MFFNLCVFALDGLLYVVGGYDCGYYGEFDDGNTNMSNNRTSSVEIYDPSTNTWSIEKIPERMTDIVGGVIIDKSLATKFHS